MPTGYTAELDDKNKTTEEWFTQDLVRAFGICVTLREEPLGLSKSAIRSKMEKDYDEEMRHHTDALKSAKVDYQKMKKYQQLQWKALTAMENVRRRESNEKEMTKTRELQSIHDRVMKDLWAIKNSGTVSDITQKIAEFGLQQLELTKHECQPFLEQEPIYWSEYKSEVMQKLQRDIDYYTEQIQETKSRWKERFSALEDITTDLKKIFPKVG